MPTIYSNSFLQQIELIAKDNKYTKWYCNIIRTSLLRATTKKKAKEIFGYVEGHHILPKSFNLGGEKDKENITFLTAREHMILHWILCKMFDDEFRLSMLRAFHCMIFKTNGNRNKRVFPKHYERAKLYCSLANKELCGERSGGYDKRHSNVNFLTREEFRSLLKTYCESDWSCVKIAKEIEISPAAVHMWLKKFNLSRRSFMRNQDELASLTSTMCLYEISEKYGVSVNGLGQKCTKFGINYIYRDYNKYPRKSTS